MPVRGSSALAFAPAEIRRHDPTNPFSLNHWVGPRCVDSPRSPLALSLTTALLAGPAVWPGDTLMNAAAASAVTQTAQTPAAGVEPRVRR